MKTNYNIFHIICFYTFAYSAIILCHIYNFCDFYLLSLKQHEKNTKYRAPSKEFKSWLQLIMYFKQTINTFKCVSKSIRQYSYGFC